MCHTITVSMHPACLNVLRGKILVHISVLCRIATKILPQLSRRKLPYLCYDIQICNPANLSLRYWYYSPEEDAWLPTVLTKKVRPSLTAIRPNILIN